MSSLAATLRRESGAEVEYLRTRVEHLEAENRELKAALAAARADAAAAQLSHGVAMPRPGSSRSFRSAGSRPSPRPPVHPIDEDRPSPIHAGSSKLREDGGDSPPATMRAVGGYRPSTASTDGSDGQKEEGMCMNWCVLRGCEGCSVLGARNNGRLCACVSQQRHRGAPAKHAEPPAALLSECVQMPHVSGACHGEGAPGTCAA